MDRPSKKLRASKEGSKTQEVEAKARQMMGFVSRASLEALVLQVVMANPETLTDLQNALPEQEKWRFEPRRRKALPAAEQCVGTGCFDAVDQDTMELILSFLNLRERIVCLSSVCRSWKDFKTLLPNLFVDLSDDSLATQTQRGILVERPLPAHRIQSLLKWVPNLAATQALRISTVKQCHPNQCKEIIKMVEKAKKKSKNKDSEELLKLVFSGPKIYASVINQATKAGWGSHLKQLHMQDIKVTDGTKLGNGCINEFFRTCPLLEELRIPQDLVTSVHMENILGELRTARGEASTTLLRVLEISGDHYQTLKGFSWPTLRKLGSTCPELEILKINYLSVALAELTFQIGPMIPLPRLKTFCLRFLYQGYPFYASTPSLTMGRILPWLFQGMPAIEDFTLGHGEPFMSQRDLKNHARPTLPSLGGSPVWPPTLERLVLHEFNLEADSLDQALPSLEEIYLHRCGPFMGSILQSVQSRRGEPTTVGFTKEKPPEPYWWNSIADPGNARSGGIHSFCLLPSLPPKYEVFRPQVATAVVAPQQEKKAQSQEAPKAPAQGKTLKDYFGAND